MIYDAESRNMTFSLAGDVILNRAISHYKEPAFLKLIELLRSTDVSRDNAIRVHDSILLVERARKGVIKFH